MLLKHLAHTTTTTWNTRRRRRDLPTAANRALTYSQHKAFYKPLYSYEAGYRSALSGGQRAADARLVWGTRYQEIVSSPEYIAWLIGAR